MIQRNRKNNCNVDTIENEILDNLLKEYSIQMEMEDKEKSRRSFENSNELLNGIKMHINEDLDVEKCRKHNSNKDISIKNLSKEK